MRFLLLLLLLLLLGFSLFILLATINDKSRWDSLLSPYLIVDVQPTKIILFVCKNNIVMWVKEVFPRLRVECLDRLALIVVSLMFFCKPRQHCYW